MARGPAHPQSVRRFALGVVRADRAEGSVTKSVWASTLGVRGVANEGMGQFSRAMRRLRAAVAVVACTCIAVLVGFVAFVATALDGRPMPPSRADGIVALSGDPQRIREAVDLLAKG